MPCCRDALIRRAAASSALPHHYFAAAADILPRFAAFDARYAVDAAADAADATIRCRCCRCCYFRDARAARADAAALALLFVAAVVFSPLPLEHAAAIFDIAADARPIRAGAATPL